MAIHVGWDNEEKTVLRYDYPGTWNWEEVYQKIDQGLSMVDSVPHPVAVIIDMTGCAGIPPGMIIHAGKLLQRQHPRIIFQAVVNTDLLIQIMANTFMRLYSSLVSHETVRLVRTVEEARRLVAQKLVENKR